MRNTNSDVRVEPSELMRHVFDEHVRNYSDPDLHFQFGASAIFEYMDVFVWQPSKEIPMTTLSTMGMAERPMDGCTHRSEIHWTIRGRLSEEDETDAAAFLANVAAFPFLRNSFFDFWHLLPNLGRIPAFANCSAGLLHPSFVEKGWDTILYEHDTIKILNFVPITPSELFLATSSGVNVMLQSMYEEKTDIFRDRKD